MLTTAPLCRNNTEITYNVMNLVRLIEIMGLKDCAVSQVPVSAELADQVVPIHSPYAFQGFELLTFRSEVYSFSL